MEIALSQPQAFAQPALGCPRCGYDQSGAIAAWERGTPPSCPLNGLCTECGLEFEWRELLNPLFVRQLRFFEHARRRKLSSFLGTWFAALRPRVFWMWVRLHHEIIWPRVAGFVILAVLFSYLLGACAIIFMNVLTNATISFFYGPSASWSFGSLGFSGGGFIRSALFTVPTTNRFIYGETVARPLIVTLFAYCLMPATFLLLPLTLRRAKVRRAHLVRIWAYAWVAVPIILAALVFIRGLISVVWLIWRYADPSRVFTQSPLWYFERYHLAALLALLWLWLFGWWAVAAARYLRLSQPLPVGFAMAVLSGLLAIGLICAIPGGATWLVWDT